MAKPKAAADRKRLQTLIQEATVDCYDEEEQQVGLLTMIEENVVCPFRARVIGEEVELTGFEPPKQGTGLFALCQRAGRTYRVDVTSLEWIDPKPEGFEWIEAYLAWREWV